MFRFIFYFSNEDFSSFKLFLNLRISSLSLSVNSTSLSTSDHLNKDYAFEKSFFLV